MMLEGSGNRERPSGRELGAVLLGIVLVGAVLRVLGITSESPWFDEVLSLVPLRETTFADFWRALAKTDPSVTLVPAYFSLEYAWSRLAGANVLAMRALSLFFGVLALPLTYLLGRRLFNPVAGLVAALCASLSVLHIFSSQEIRMYAASNTLALLSALTLLRALDSNTRGRWLAHMAVNALLLATHLFWGLLLVVEACYLLLFCRQRIRTLAIWGTGHAAIALAAGTWVCLMVSRGMTRNSFWTPLPSLREAANLAIVLAGGRFSNENPSAYLATHVSLDYVLTVLLFGLACWLVAGSIRAMRHPADPDSIERLRAVALLVLWLVLPPVALYLLSYVYHPCFLYRYAVHCSFPLYLLAGGAVASFRGPALRELLIAVLVGLYAHQYLALPLPFRPDYRSAAELIRTSADQEDTVIAFKEINAVPFAYIDAVPADRLKHVQGFRELEAEVLGAYFERRNVWVVMWRWDDTAAFETRLHACGVLFNKAQFGGMPPLLLYHVAGAPPGV